MTYGQVLKVLRNQDKYSPTQIEKAKKLLIIYKSLETCPVCSAIDSHVLIQKLGMCESCHSWERYNKKYEKYK